MKTLFVSPYVPSSVNAIKLASLYFDEVVLYERTLIEVEPVEPVSPGQTEGRGRVRALVSTIDGKLVEAIRPLIDENLVRIESDPPRHLLQLAQRESLRGAFLQAEDLLFKYSEDRTEMMVDLGEGVGVQEIHARLVGPIKMGGRFHIEAVGTYYEGLFVESIDAALRGESVLSSSSVLYKMIERAASGNALKSTRVAEVFPSYAQPRLAIDVLGATLMDSSVLDCGDVLEVRHQLRDELAAFRSELQRLQFDFTKEFGADKVFRDGRAIADARLTPRVREIEGKVKSSRIRVLRRLLEALEKPGAYVPLVGSLFAGVPLEIAIGLSVGLISARVALEALEEHKLVANDGLFYLVKMKELLRYANPTIETCDRLLDEGQEERFERRFAWPEMVEVIPDEELKP